LGEKIVNELLDIGIRRIANPVRCAPLAAPRWAQQPQAIYSVTTLGDALDLSGDAAGWVVEAAKKLEALGRFRTGWDSYGGLPLRRGVKSLTLQVLGWLRKDELPVPRVVLGSAGNVQLEWRANGKELEIELRDNNSIEYVKVSPGGDIEEGESALNLSGSLRDLTGWLLRS
jgi:hypothetical protein